MEYGSVLSRRAAPLVVGACCVLCLAAPRAAADEVVLTNGSTYKGRVISQTPAGVKFEAVVGSGVMVLDLPGSRVKSVTVDGIYPKPGPAEPPETTKPGAVERPEPETPRRTTDPKPAEPDKADPLADPAAKSPAGDTKSKAEIEALIEQQGKTPPDWWDDTPLEYPQTLDLTWGTTGKFDPQRVLGSYLWGVLNPNPNRWKGGVRLLHHVLTINKNDPTKLQRTADELGRTYAEWLEDYPRAAYWRRKGGGESNFNSAVGLAECYWRMGSRSMAVEALSRQRTVGDKSIRLWAQLGETQRALQLADLLARSRPHDGHVLAAEICRVAEKYPQAESLYQKVLALPTRNAHEKKLAARARAGLEATRILGAVDVSKLSDGTHTGTGVGYRGEVEVAVEAKDGKIVSVRITKQKEDGLFYHRASRRIAPAIVERQGLGGVDAVTGATFTSEAIISGAAKALASGTK